MVVSALIGGICGERRGRRPKIASPRAVIGEIGPDTLGVADDFDCGGIKIGVDWIRPSLILGL